MNTLTQLELLMSNQRRAILVSENLGIVQIHLDMESAMKDWVGVLHWSSCLDIPKKELLLFDKVGVVHLEGALVWHRNDWHGEPEIADQLEWLEEQGLLIRTEGPPQNFYWDSGRESDLRLMHALYDYAEKLRDESFGPWKKTRDGKYRNSLPTPENIRRMDQSRKADEARTSLVARTTADYLTSTRSVSAVSAEPVPDILYDAQAVFRDTAKEALHSDVAHVVLSALPQPNELTPIEDLIEFKQDSEASQRLLGLRIWMRDMIRAKLPPVELEEKLEWLLHEYQKHMELHRLKVRKGTLETVITTSLEIAENLVKIKWSEAAKALFSIRRRKLALLEAEATAPGREISYVAWAKRRFTSGTE